MLDLGVSEFLALSVFESSGFALVSRCGHRDRSLFCYSRTYLPAGKQHLNDFHCYLCCHALVFFF